MGGAVKITAKRRALRHVLDPRDESLPSDEPGIEDRRAGRVERRCSSRRPATATAPVSVAQPARAMTVRTVYTPAEYVDQATTPTPP